MNGNRTVILASASPRRTALLELAGIPHRVLPSACEERTSSTVPHQVVMELSRQKAEDVYDRYLEEHGGEDFLVIGSDTVVAVGEQILGKPADEADAFRMISLLQNNTHQVYTGVTILSHAGKEMTANTFYECSDVTVYPMTEAEIRAYIATGEPMDKAGAYGIQGKFAVYVRRIAGDYNTIVGLPLARLYQELKRLFRGKE